MTREGVIWHGMMRRTKKEGDTQLKHPCYKDCEVSENFKNFQFFAEWCNRQKGFHTQDGKGRYFALDKDIVKKGNKFYSEELCVFVPQAVNLFFTDRRKSKGLHMQGVCWHVRDLKYTAQCNDGNSKIVHLGYFEKEMDAFYAYKTFKESLAKKLASKWAGFVDMRVVEALNAFEVGMY